MARRSSGSITGKNSVELFGDWDGCTKFLNSMGYEVDKKVKDSLWVYAKKLRDIVKNHIIHQDLNLADTSERTKKLKKQNKDLILIDTEVYVQNIKAWRDRGNVYVGVKRNLLQKRKGQPPVPVDKIASWLEEGTRKMPPRPHWKPSIEEMGGKEGLKEFVIDAIFRRLKWLARGKEIVVTRSSVLAKLKFK